MTIKEYQEMVDNWINNVGVRYFSELTNTALLAEEVGEISRLMARLYGDQSFKKEMNTKDAMRVLSDEMADALFVLTCLANQTGIDLTEAIQRNMIKKTKRDHSRHKTNPKLKDL